MKRFFWVLTLLSLTVCSVGYYGARAQSTIFTPSCAGTNDTTAFSNIITTIGSNQGTIRLPYKNGTRCAVNNLTIPANVTLDNSDGTGIKINTGQTLTPLGPLVNPLGKRLFYNALAGQGTVILTDNRAIHELPVTWWGAIGDWNGTSGTDNGPAFTATITAAKTVGVVTVLLPAGSYKSSSAISLASTSGMLFTCSGAGGTNSPVNKRCGIFFDVAGSSPLIDTTSSDNLTISNLELRYVNASLTGDVIGRPNGSTSFGLRIKKVFIGGTLGVATSARSGVNFANCNTCSIDDYYLYLMNFGISNFGGSYSNEITIGKGTFDQYAYYGAANPYFGWVFRDAVFEPSIDGQTRGIACAINESGVVDGAGAGSQCVKVSIEATNFWDDTASGGININYSGSGLVVLGGISSHSVAGVSKTYIRLRAGGNGFFIAGTEFRAANTSIFISNDNAKFRGFYENSNILKAESGTITRLLSPAYLMNTAASGSMDLTTAQITTRAAQYVGEESDHRGVTVFDTTLGVPNVWDGTAFRKGIAQFSSYGETLIGTCTLNLNSATVQDCVTNNTGKTLAVTRAVFRDATPGVFSGGSTTGLFIKEGAGDTFLGGGVVVTNANNAAHFLVAVTSGAGSNVPRTIANGAKVRVLPDPAYGSAQTCTVDIFGYLY